MTHEIRPTTSNSDPIKPDWNVFKAKFKDQQEDFQWLCYLLFCKEHNKPSGIFRYKNQAAIENDPIQIGDRIVGWQAKFFDTSLSKNSSEIIKMILSAKEKYAGITEIIFYTNQEWGQTKAGGEPKSKRDVEKAARDAGITLVLRMASYFESPDVAVNNAHLVRYFFTLDAHIIDSLAELRSHTATILNQIHASISYNEKTFEIDRASDLDAIRRHTGQVVILSGGGGAGKTAIVKMLWEKSGITPFYLFKASEFELRNISDLLQGFNLANFLGAHEGMNDKVVVIDAAENLLDLKNDDPFKEFVSGLIREGWKIIFTTRDGGLEYLDFQFIDIYHVVPLHINLQNLRMVDLAALSGQHGFSLPKDQLVLELIRNPFYLGEYLALPKKAEDFQYLDFKQKVWDRRVRKSKPSREVRFLQFARARATSGGFFVTPSYDTSVLDDELVKDGILGFESPYGYFVAHDIYEEWALEKVIESEFAKKANANAFFQAIGDTLPMRRAFRKWVSEKLLLKDADTKTFIEREIKENSNSFWTEEILVAVLLSEYSATFFDQFKNELIADDLTLLTKIFFLLQIACKEVDDTLFGNVKPGSIDPLALKYLMTRPRGKGWESALKFVLDNLDAIGIQRIHLVIPVAYDWNSRHRTGEATRWASTIALRYYQWTIAEDITFSSRDDFKDKILQTILSGASEIKDELAQILDQVIDNNWKRHRDPFHPLSETILTTFEGVWVSHILPTHVLRLANLFWTYAREEDSYFSHASLGIEEHFGMEDHALDYFPASAYQTPTYWLLQNSLQETVDFILEFTNRAVEQFAKSDFAKHEIEEIDVVLDVAVTIKQYISDRIWKIYRGTHVAPHVLESMHMALERRLLELGKDADGKVLESWLYYLLSRSRSSSISALVVSVVLAYPEKTFNIAAILFKTKEFFLYDTSRLLMDHGQKGQLQSLREGFGSRAKNEFHEDERIAACDEPHRKISLENLFLQYQFFQTEGMSEENVRERQEVLWSILDEHYKQLPPEEKQSNQDKTWRLYLARMDRRKMNPVIRKTDEGSLVEFHPEIDSKLKHYSEAALKESSAAMEHTSLKLWATYRLSSDQRYLQYPQYENDPILVLKEVRKICSNLKAEKRHGERGTSYVLLNSSIPTDACSVLLRYSSDSLSDKDQKFCVQIVLSTAMTCIAGQYKFAMSDGVTSAFMTLSEIYKQCPSKREKIKRLLLLSLFNDYSVDMSGSGFHVLPVTVVIKLWPEYPDDAQSLLAGYLLLKQKFDELGEEMRKERHTRREYSLTHSDVLSEFEKRFHPEIQKVVKGSFTLADVNDIESLDLSVLSVAFKMIPVTTDRTDHKILISKVITNFAKELVRDDREDRIDYSVRHDFIQQLSYFLLKCPKEDIRNYINPFIKRFKASKEIGDLFTAIISMEDRVVAVENFWELWQLFEEQVVEACKGNSDRWYVDEVIKSYLFAKNPWQDSAVEWHTFRDKDKDFFRDLADSLGHRPTTLYTLAKLLNGIGSVYADDGVYWISGMLKKNGNLRIAEPPSSTIIHLEIYVKKFVYKNRMKIKKSAELRAAILEILGYLIQKGSVTGWILRETLL